MKTMNFWRALFFSALAVTAFTGCKNDDDDANDGNGNRATITVDGKSAVALGVKAAADETVDVKVVSSGDWELVYNDATPDWLAASAEVGKSGETTVTFTVTSALPEDVEFRSATATFRTRGYVLGSEYWAKATVTITQSESGSPVGDTNVAQIRALLKAMNPTTTKVDVTEEIAAMTIRGVVVSEASGVNLTNAYYIAIQDADNAPNSGLALNATQFKTLALSAGTVVAIPLTAAQVGTYGEALYLYINNDAAVETTPGVAPEPIVVTPPQLGDYESMLVKIENCYPTTYYGKPWYDAALGTTSAGNVPCATFAGETFTCRVGKEAAFKDELIPEKSGSLTGIAGQYKGSMQISPRVLADIQLTGEIPAPEYRTATISEITAAGNFKVENATVIATYAVGFLMQDATGIILVYPGEGATIPAAGKVVTVEGAVSVYGGVLQFGQGSTVTETGDAEVPAPEEAVEITADNIAGFMTSPKITYVKMTGNFAIDGNYRNLTFPFETSYMGSIVAPAVEGSLDEYNGKLVDITGWFLNNANGNTYLSVLAMDVKENTTEVVVSFTSEPTTFAATAPAEQTIDFVAQNLPEGALVEFDFTGDDAAQFSVVSQTDNTVTIKAVGDNTSDGDYMAVLTASVNNEVLDEVHVRQLAPAGSDTRGTYTSMSIFESSGASTANPAGLGASKVGDADASGVKLGTGSKVGTFTSGALDVTGSKKLGFYAVGWKGKSNVPLKITVNGGGSASVTTFSLNGNEGATGNPPFAALAPTDDDYYVVQLSDLTETSTITFETTDADNGRAVVFGVQLFD